MTLNPRVSEGWQLETGNVRGWSIRLSQPSMFAPKAVEPMGLKQEGKDNAEAPRGKLLP